MKENQIYIYAAYDTVDFIRVLSVIHKDGNIGIFVRLTEIILK